MAHDLDSVKAAFKNLKLEVCDDAQRIEAQAQAMKKMVDAKASSPDGRERAWAAQWQKDVADLRQKRAEMLEVVYASFRVVAKTQVVAVVHGGERVLTRELAERIAQIAREHCRLDRALSWTWFEQRFCPEEGLRIGKEVVVPHPVEQFQALSGRDKIDLRWQKPAEKCEEVEIVREAETAPAGSPDAEPWSEKFRGTSGEDGTAVRGIWYRYRAYSWCQGIRGKEVRTARALRWAEPDGVRFHATANQVEISWELSPTTPIIRIYRRRNAAPQLRRGRSGWEPTDAETTGHDGGRGSWRDMRVNEGETCFYRVVADFGSGVVSDGIELRVTVPRRPAPVAKVTADYRPEGERDQVVLTWPPAPSTPPAQYLVVRREGLVPPSSAADGEVFGPVDQPSLADRGVAAGCCYTYAVFTVVGELQSRSGTASRPVAILSDVRSLQATAGDGSVELHWETPLHVCDVLVRRGLVPPADLQAGEPVRVTNRRPGQPGLARDGGLCNGQTYHYLVACRYQLAGCPPRESAGLRTTAEPLAPPDAVHDFRVQADGQAVHCVWTPPRHGQVLVRRHGQRLEYQTEALLKTDEVLRLGRAVATSPGRAQDDAPDANEPYYSVFTVAGERAAYGATGSAILCPDVTDLRLMPTPEGVCLEWFWPRDCTAVRIVRRLGEWPRGPDDPTAIVLSQVEYRNSGNCYLDRIHERGGYFHYVVYVQISGGRETMCSPGTGPSCRAAINYERPMLLKYRLKPASRWKLRARDLLLEWELEYPLPEPPEFVLVANSEQTPAAIGKGLELLRWHPRADAVGRKHQERVALDRVRQLGWGRFFCRVFPADPEHSKSVFLMHPDVCQAWSSAGRSPAIVAGRPTGYYRQGVPHAVICPTCFEEFPLSRVRFADADGNILDAHYGWRDRLLRRPLQSPADRSGRKCAVKLCPSGHQLPFNTGTQNSLVIGLIGARASGKSHYIASLIDRLQGQAGLDMEATLMPVTDETLERYRREFHEPLFIKHLQLPATPRLPPPLIYELTVNRRLWGQQRDRSVTLALYDTAGEDLNDSQVVQQMLLYLKVAAGILLLTDPLQMPGLRQLLPASSLPPVLKDADPHPILDRVIPVLEQRRLATRAGRLSLPMAVVMTKCDALRDAKLIEPNRVWQSNLRHSGHYSRQLHEDMHGMMGEYLQRWSNHVYTTVTQRFVRHAFFGVSATGCAPDPKLRQFPHVSPHRVEDPLLWLLAELGVIPAL